MSTFAGRHPDSSGNRPPVRHLPYLLVALFMGAVSLVGLLLPDLVYPNESTRQAFQTNDLVNLLIGMPALLLPLWLMRRRRHDASDLTGRLLLPGGLLYVVYNYTAYAFGRSVDWFTVVTLALVLLSAFAAIDFVRRLERGAIAGRIAAGTPVWLTGLVLIVFGVGFFYRAIDLLIGAGALPLSDIGVLVADLLLSVLWVVGGALLLGRRPLGYVAALGLLYAAAALFAGLIFFMLLNPPMTGAPFNAEDVVVVAAMSLVCFVPFVLCLRGVVRSAESRLNG